MSPNNNSAAYMKIHNPTKEQINILGASALAIANNVELHKSFVDEKGVSRMTSIDKIVVPAQSTIELAPGGLHIMLFDLKERLIEGDVFELNLNLENKESVTLSIKVMRP
jgi:copper(I)-binding protein